MTISVSTGFPVRGPAGFFAAVLAMLILMAGPLDAQDKDPLVAKVNGVEVHQSDLAVAEDEAGQIPPMSPEAKQDYLVQFVADMILVSKAAQDKKFGETSRLQTQARIRPQQAADGRSADSRPARKPSPTTRCTRSMTRPSSRSAKRRKCMPATSCSAAPAGDEKAGKEAEDKIKAVIVRLKKGEDFAKVAGEVTEDPSGKANGGDLGYFTKEQMVPEFSDTAFKLDKGQISEPVKTQFGWHVIKVEDKRIKPAPKFEEVKPQIENYVVRKAQAELVTKLRADAKIERMDKRPQKPMKSLPRRQRKNKRSALSIAIVMAGLVPAISLR